MAASNSELCANILSLNLDEYKLKVENFLQDKGCMEDGHASERAVDKIIEIIETKGS